MKKLLFLVILLLLNGCAFDESQLLIPNFGLTKEVESPQIDPISWTDIEYQDLKYIAKDDSCSMIYISHAFSQDCDDVNDEIFNDFDIVEDIHYSFYAYRVNQDNPDFELILNVFDQKDVPIVVFLHSGEITLWNRESGLSSLNKIIKDLSKECQVGHHN